MQSTHKKKITVTSRLQGELLLLRITVSQNVLHSTTVSHTWHFSRLPSPWPTEMTPEPEALPHLPPNKSSLWLLAASFAPNQVGKLEAHY